MESVREELEATALIEVKENDDVEEKEPELVDEHDDDKKNTAENKFSEYSLHFDGIEGITRNAAKADTNIDAKEETSNSNQEGLRRRKNKGGNNTDESKATTWIEEEPTTIESQKALQDPLQLFGVPPPSLRVAQSHSRDALAYYVEVANVARQIMTIVQEGE